MVLGYNDGKQCDSQADTALTTYMPQANNKTAIL